MAPAFDYDPDEIVSVEGHDISLRDAVRRFRQDQAGSGSPQDLSAVRDPGKIPQVFKLEHFKALLQDPQFERQGGP